ncbi:MAG: hypothetical protein AAF787_10995 [Chloroflexota bacterium]
MVGLDSVKLLMNWDVKTGRDQDFFEFVMRDWVPGITRLGLEPTGAWYTTYSHDDNDPRYMAEGIVDNLNQMNQILESDEWDELHERLLEYVDNYSHKIVRVSGGFQF